ncbi:MAG: damage-inducible protein CinA [Acidiferrobacteraceae bacterium]|nr:damage-inducible protein CinA [Acidiferrobacteraceae bacterium]
MEHLQKLATTVGQLLVEKNQRISTVESCTGGWLGKTLTDVVGSSRWYECGFVTYSNASKTKLVGVNEKLIQECGAVSEPVAKAMACGALEYTDTDIAIAITGVAGPDGGTIDKPVGTVWLAWAARNYYCKAECQLLNGDRTSVREQSVSQALTGLILLLERDLFR